MASLDERAAAYRNRMVDGFPARGIVDERVLAAMRAVPRHRFVERFAGAPPGAKTWSLDETREWTVDEDCDDETLELVHDAERALPAPGFTRFDILTSVSAPGLVAQMLQQLDVRAGMRVLEIGAGSGYNAALLAELGAEVTSVDIDASLIEPARARLRALGRDDVVVLEVDGDLGVPERAPFDRIIGTVGCNDLSPAWFAQLAPGGRMLVPVFHGAGHPLVEAHADGTSRLVGPAGFVPVQGRQSELDWWSSAHRAFPTIDPRWTLSARELFAVTLYIALRDRDAMNGHLVDDWDALGRPAIDRYTATWTARTGEGDIDAVAGPWRIPRVHHDEVITLS
jgi:protein-L-isoaspartate(D-aspartate) O-methyltransferase